MTDEEMEFRTDLISPLSEAISILFPEIEDPYSKASLILFPDFWKVDDDETV